VLWRRRVTSRETAEKDRGKIGKEEAERNLVRFIVVSFARCQKSPLKLQNTPTAQFQQQKDKRKNSEEPKNQISFFKQCELVAGRMF
jgi:hypothetical protein